MRSKRTLGFVIPAILGMAGLAAVTVGATGSGAARETAGSRTSATAPWPTRALRGSTTLGGQVPLVVSNRNARYLRPHSAKAEVRLNFTLPLRDRAGLDALIAQQAHTHRST